MLKNKILTLILGLGLGLSSGSQAVIQGQFDYSLKNSVFRISFEVLRYVRELNEERVFDTKCGATVVGVNPLTLLTAAHCTDGVYTEPGKNLPNVRVLNEKGEEVAVHLVKILTHTKLEFSRNISLDKALLVFAENTPQYSPIPILGHREEISALYVCGYGSTSEEESPSVVRCATKKTIKHEELASVLPSSLQSDFPMYYKMALSSLESTLRIVNGNSTNSLLLSRLNEAGEYSLLEPITKEGDSGGPWFTKLSNGKFAIAGICSLAELMPKSMMGRYSRTLQRADLPFASVANTVYSQESLEFFREAKTQGADIAVIL